jgi:hypothetical protein
MADTAPTRCRTAVGRFNAPSRCEAYRALFADQLDPRMTCAIRESTNGNVALGTTRFQAEIETMLQRRARRGAPGRPKVGDAKSAGGTHVESKNVVCP